MISAGLLDALAVETVSLAPSVEGGASQAASLGDPPAHTALEKVLQGEVLESECEGGPDCGSASVEGGSDEEAAADEVGQGGYGQRFDTLRDIWAARERLSTISGLGG
jgi:hypothetical protein